ncbi:MAG TPA: putative toxin-antitoxin system toxin component, PIN family [Verrucomicrobiae bacterium]
MRVVFDTNVLVSAFTSIGLCHQAYERALTRTDIIIAHRLLDELHRTLVGKMKIEKSLADEILAELADELEVIKPLPLSKPICRDKDDDWVLATALTGHGEIIVSGDKDLLVLKQFQGIKILSPRQFIEFMDAQK